MTRLDRWARGLFGPRLSGQAFGRCLQLAFLYPFVLFLIAYALGGSRQMSGGSLLWAQEGLPRAGTTATLVALTLGLFFWFRFVNDDEHGLSAWLTLRLGAGRSWTSGWRWRIVRLGVLFGSVFAAALSAIAAFAAAAVALDFAFAVAAAVAVAVAVAVAAAAAAAAAVVASAFAIFSFHSPFDYAFTAVLVAAAVVMRASGGLLTLLILLPFINAVVDWLSCAVTRWFVREGARRGATVRVFLEFWVDAVAAVGTLCLLAVFLPNAIAGVDRLLPPEHRGDWLSVAVAARDDPWGAGFMVTGMLLTTLLPTAVHLWVGLRGVLVWPRADHHVLAAELRAVPAGDPLPVRLENRVIAAIRVARLWLGLAGLMAVAILWAIGAAALYAAPGIGAALFDLAIWSTCWDRGDCAETAAAFGERFGL